MQYLISKCLKGLASTRFQVCLVLRKPEVGFTPTHQREQEDGQIGLNSGREEERPPSRQCAFQAYC